MLAFEAGCEEYCEIEADEVGASLKFAQASLHKPRRDATGKSGQFNDEPPF